MGRQVILLVMLVVCSVGRVVADQQYRGNVYTVSYPDNFFARESTVGVRFFPDPRNVEFFVFCAANGDEACPRPWLAQAMETTVKVTRSNGREYGLIRGPEGKYYTEYVEIKDGRSPWRAFCFTYDSQALKKKYAPAYKKLLTSFQFFGIAP